MYLKKILLLVTILFSLFAISCSVSHQPEWQVDGDTNVEDGDLDIVADGDDAEGETIDGDDESELSEASEDPIDGDEELAEIEEKPITCEIYEDRCCFEDKDCASGKCYQGVCVQEPKNEATIWWEDSYYDNDLHDKVGSYKQIMDGDKPASPDFSCSGSYIDVEDGGTVDIRATIKVFGVESPCTTLSIAVFTQFDGSGNAKTQFLDNDAEVIASVQEMPDENYECHILLENVPAGKWLVFKTYEISGTSFKDTYQFNNYIKTRDAGNTEFDMEVNAISNSSWSLIPPLAGVTAGISQGKGVISGSLKDCKGRLIEGATLGLSVWPTSFVYFDANIQDLYPDQNLKATNTDATYAAINQPAHPVKAVSLARIDDEIVVIGNFSFLVLPNSVSIYGIHGAQPSNYGYFVEPN